jgi:SAM-dependent methyltransferase
MPLTPARTRGHEILDDPTIDPELARRSLLDIALANRLFGGRRAVLRELAAVLEERQRVDTPPDHAPHNRTARWSLLDVGTGLGDIPEAAAEMARARRWQLDTIGVEVTALLARDARARCAHAIAADAMALPFADRSVDVVTCSQVLHHFEDEHAIRLLRECTRVARLAVIIGELRRSWLALAGLWASSFALGFAPVSRHDGMVSIRRGFTCDDLTRLIRESTGITPVVQHSLGWRVTARWAPALLPI